MSEDQEIPLLDRQPDALAVDPILKRRRQSKSTSKLTPCRFLLAILIFFGGAFFAILVFFLLKAAWGSLQSSRFPHRDHHHPKANLTGEGEVVRSFFGPAAEGGQERFDLIASVYYRQKVVNETLMGQLDGLEKVDTIGDGDGLDALAVAKDEEEDDEKLIWGPWERVFSQVVSQDLTIKSKRVKTEVKVSLPGKLIPSLRNSTRDVQLYGIFNVIPSALDGGPNGLIPLNATHSWNPPITSTTLPRPWPVIGDTLEEQKTAEQVEDSWRLKMLRYSAYQSLLRQVVNDTQSFGDLDLAEVLAQADDDEKKKKKKSQGKTHALVTRSQVTMIEDFPVYSLAPFQEQMKKQGKLLDHCATFDDKKFHPTFCRRDFSRIGHFQSLYEMGTPEDALVWKAKEAARKSKAEEGSEETGVDVAADGEEEERDVKGWRYGPFVQATLGGAGPKDLVFFPNATDAAEEEPDYIFDWHITFSLLSPLKASVASSFSNGFHGDSISNNRSDHNIAEGQDHAEFISALAGHPFDPTTRPLLRKFLRSLSSLLTFVSLLLSAHFWCTRLITTGISMPAQTISSVYDYASFIALSVYEGDWKSWEFGMTLVFVTGCSMVLWSLALGLEWGWWGWVPSGVERRKRTHSERQSGRVDGRFSWGQRGITFLSLFLLFTNLTPRLPHLITASPPQPLIAPAGTLRFSSDSYLRFLEPFNNAIYLSLFIAQFLLNHRSRTFGASYRIQAVVEFVSEFVHVLPVLMSARWGRWELMEKWAVDDLVRLGCQGAMMWQAWRYRGVRQEEEEEE